MEAFGALTHGDLPPAGNRISLQQRPLEQLPGFPDYHSLWLDCGTSALAVALLAAKKKNPHINAPEVVVPAYCCPDLVAAAQFADVRVVVADIDESDPALATTSLQEALSENTVAVIAVNFLGIKEKLPELGRFLLSHPHISLVEDNAQWFPDPQDFSELTGDYVVFSFGRGKPLSLLGGGLLLMKESPAVLAIPLTDLPTSSTNVRFKMLAYNLLLKPRFYQLLNRNPLLKLGETRYQALPSVYSMDNWRKSLLPKNIECYAERSRSLEDIYDKFFTASINQLKPLHTPRRMRLLRYPLLLNDTASRDDLLHDLQRAGLGATAMYQKPLLEIDGMRKMVVTRGRYDNAAAFARRLITLPLHEGVTASYVNRISRLVSRHLNVIDE